MRRSTLLCSLTLCAALAAATMAAPAAGGNVTDAKDAAPAQAPAETPATAAEPQRETMPEGCVRLMYAVHSPSMDRDIRVAVVLPPAYEADPSLRLPVIYAMHGMGAPYATYTDMAPLRQFLVDHPMILVCFDGDRDSCYVDATVRPKSLFTTFFFDELLPHVEAAYRTNGQRAATGFSMGGYGAMHYMLTRPESFTSVSSQSGAFYLFAPPSEIARLSTNTLLGPYAENKAAYERAAIYSRVAARVEADAPLPPMLLMCGTEDRLQTSNREFVDFLAARNADIHRKIAATVAGVADKDEQRRRMAELEQRMLIDFRYVESPGGHNWPYWRGTSRELAEFHWQHFQKAAPAAAGTPPAR